MPIDVADLRPAPLDLLLYAGDGTTLTIHFKNKTTGLPLDMSDYTFASSWRPERASANADAIAFNVDDSSKATGTIIVGIDALATRAMSANGVWDFTSVPSGGDPRTLLTGNVKVTEDVTR